MTYILAIESATAIWRMEILGLACVVVTEKLGPIGFDTGMVFVRERFAADSSGVMNIFGAGALILWLFCI